MAAVYQYEDYLKKDKILSFEEAREIQKKMAEEIFFFLFPSFRPALGRTIRLKK